MDNFETIRRAGFRELKFQPPFVWWMNWKIRMCFRFDAVEDATAKWLTKTLKEKVPPGEFVFYYPPGVTRRSDTCDALLETLRIFEHRSDMRTVE
ncbi:MAG: hypothetical protein Q7S58_12800 [Candidatus Binatus sp.]|uniref:hypothetical protein n=1 Tax=Candidatus Binatus sp. TaxID=2811406 RepID=UPI0027211737|nr:hypothetical protein [Candidatus Binatus sp.]MDO8433278.1 hypothetical protein [Candidatus Binatus sp.]